MIRKFLLTSVVLTVDPNSRMQLWFGLVLSVAFVTLSSKRLVDEDVEEAREI